MPSFNSCTFIGHLARDPEVRYTQAGLAVCSGAIGVNYGYGDRKDSFFLDFAAFGKTAEKLGEWCQKGDAILLQGELQEDKWQDKKTGEQRRKFKLNVREWTKMSSKGGSRSKKAEPVGANFGTPGKPAPVDDEDMDSIPF